MAFALAGLASAVAGGPAPSVEDVQRAARIWGGVEVLREDIGIFMPTPDRTRYERACAYARTQISAEAWAVAWQQGRALSLEQATTRARLADS